MISDLKSGPFGIVLLQEAKCELLWHLQQLGQEGVAEDDDGVTRGGGARGKQEDGVL